MAVSLITCRRRQLQTAVDQVSAGISRRFHEEQCPWELSLLREFDREGKEFEPVSANAAKQERR